MIIDDYLGGVDADIQYIGGVNDLSLGLLMVNADS